MQLELKLLAFAGHLILPLTVGFLLRRQGGRRFFDRAMRFNLLVISTLLACLSFWAKDLSLQHIWLPIIGAAMQILPGGVAWPLAKRKFRHPHEQGGYILATVFANRTITGLLSVYILFGEDGFACARLAMLLGPFGFYLIGMPLADYFARLSREATNSVDPTKPPAAKRSLKDLLLTRNQIPLLGLALGVCLNQTGMERPPVFGSFFPVLVGINAWLFLVPVGAGIDFGEMRRYWARVADLLVIKFIAVPLAIAGLCTWVGLAEVERGSLIVISFAPAAVGAVIAARLNKLDTHLPMAAYLLTTAVYLVVVFPVLLIFFST